MGASDELCFEVYVRTREAVVTVVRQVNFRTAHALARHYADKRGEPAYIRNRLTYAVETIGPSIDRARA
jgi:hypothetical protein